MLGSATILALMAEGILFGPSFVLMLFIYQINLELAEVDDALEMAEQTEA